MTSGREPGATGPADGRWRYILASALGTSHAASGAPCQDACTARLVEADGGDVLVLACSDGAGSASHSAIGSRVACDTVVGEVADSLERGGSVARLTDAQAQNWYFQTHRALVARAEEVGVPPRQLACTLLLAVIAPTAAVFAQIGDGAIVAALPTGQMERTEQRAVGIATGDTFSGTVPAAPAYVPVTWPQNGEYANMTYFLTEPEALTHVVVTRACHRVDEVALFTDGIQGLALRFEDRTAHAPFFRPMFARLRAEAPGLPDALRLQLEQFLNAPALNARTDDDKTLILATRRAPVTAATPAPASDAAAARAG